MSQLTDKMSLSELVTALGEARTQASNLYNSYKEAKGIEDGLRFELEMRLRSENLKTVKGSDYTAVMTEKPTVLIQNESAIIEWLNQEPDVDTDYYIGLKRTEFNTLAQQVLKSTGEVIPGTTVEIKESLAIRSNKKKGE